MTADTGFTDDEIIKAIELCYGLVHKASRYLNQNSIIVGRKISASQINKRIELSERVKEAYQEARNLVIDEAEYTIISKMLGHKSSARKDMNAALLILRQYSLNWKESQTSKDGNNVFVNLGPNFSTQDWKEKFESLKKDNVNETKIQHTTEPQYQFFNRN